MYVTARQSARGLTHFGPHPLEAPLSGIVPRTSYCVHSFGNNDSENSFVLSRPGATLKAKWHRKLKCGQMCFAMLVFSMYDIQGLTF